MRAALYVLGAGALVACSTDEFASVDDGGDASADVAVDRGLNDAAPDGDAKADSGPDAAAFACDQASLQPTVVCSDFESTFPPVPFATSMSGGAITQASAPNFLSPSNSARAAIPPGLTTANAEVTFSFTDTTKDRFVMRLAFRVTSLLGGAVRVAAFSFPPAVNGLNPLYAVAIDGASKEVRLGTRDSVGGSLDVVIGMYELNKWHRVEIDMHILTNANVSAKFDGVQKNTGFSAGLASTSNGKRDVSYGAKTSAALPDAAEIFIDDIALSAPP